MKVLKSNAAIAVYQLVGIMSIAPLMIFAAYMA
jgi:hypothetical protein